jgi:hypothetical protein
MRVALRVAEALTSAGIRPNQLEAELDISEDRIREFMSGQFKQISRRDLNILATWAKLYGIQLVDWTLHPIWSTFVDRPTAIFVESIRKDTGVADDLQRAVHALGGSVDLWRDQPSEDSADITNKMRTFNTIFVGAPKRNRKSEIAYTALCHATPFDEASENRRKLGFLFAGEKWVTPGMLSAWALNATDQTDFGLSVGQSILPVTYFKGDDAAFRQAEGRGVEAGALVVARRPLGTDQNVTSIIIAGYTSLGTAEVAKELMWETVDLEEKDLAPGNVVTRILRVPFRKSLGAVIKVPQRGGREWFHLDSPTEDWLNRRMPKRNQGR